MDYKFLFQTNLLWGKGLILEHYLLPSKEIFYTPLKANFLVNGILGKKLAL